MLKYHNYDNKEEPLEILVNGIRLNLTDEVGRELINNMRKTYFALFDLISITDMDSLKQKLMKNKVKSIAIEIWSKMMKDYAESTDVHVFTDSLNANGIIIQQLDDFLGFAFSDAKKKEYFMTEVLKVFSTNIYSLSVLK